MPRRLMAVAGGAAIAAAALAVGCTGRTLAPTPVVETSASGSALLATASSSKTLYFLTFSGDIQSGPLGPIALNPNNPWVGLNLNSATLTLPSGELHGSGCPGVGTTNWGGNVGPWTGDLDIRQKGNLTHLGFQVSVAGSITLNLAINHNATSSTSGGKFLLTFTNARAYLGASSPDPAADPCVTFTVTATPQ